MRLSTPIQKFTRSMVTSQSALMAQITNSSSLKTRVAKQFYLISHPLEKTEIAIIKAPLNK